MACRLIGCDVWLTANVAITGWCRQPNDTRKLMVSKIFFDDFSMTSTRKELLPTATWYANAIRSACLVPIALSLVYFNPVPLNYPFLPAPTFVSKFSRALSFKSPSPIATRAGVNVHAFPKLMHIHCTSITSAWVR
jgi:hypothetical protein